jgi:hypothetical protein
MKIVICRVDFIKFFFELGSKAPVLFDADDKEIDVDQGSEFSLECRDTAAIPKPRVQWFMKIVRPNNFQF